MFNYNTKPGEILKEYLDSRDINQKELAQMTNSSERHISQIINGKARITEEFALKLEDVFSDVKAEFWLSLETKYQLFLLRNKNNQELKNKKIIADFQLDYLFKGLGYDDEEKVSEFFNIVEEPNINSLNKSLKENQAFYMHDGGDEKLLYLWIKLCEEQIDLQDNLDPLPKFNHESFLNQYDLLKSLLYTQNYKLAIKNVRRLLNANGINLVLEEALPNSKVRGAVKKYKDYLAIFLSTRYKRIDSLYFALIHEVFHIVNKDYEKQKLNISYEQDEKEIMSNELARNFFIPLKDYNNILKALKDKGISDEELLIQADKHNVVVDILIGFLQRDGHIQYNQFNHLRNYIKEDD